MSISPVTSANAASSSRIDSSEFLQKMFDRLDGDRDGKITKEEFSTSVEKRFRNAGNPSGEKPDAAAVFKSVDSDEDGAIDVTEFKTAVSALREQDRAQSRGSAGANEMSRPGGRPPGGPPPASAEEEAEQVFDELDTNKDGTVSIEELMASLVDDSKSSEGTEDTKATSPQAELEKLFKAVDADNDGSISKSELATVFEEMRKRADEDGATQAAYGTDGVPSFPPAIGENLSASV